MLPRGVRTRRAMRKVVDCSKTTRIELVCDLKAVRTTVPKNTIGNSLFYNGLKCCSAQKVPVLNKAHVQACLKFTIYLGERA